MIMSPRLALSAALTAVTLTGCALGEEAGGDVEAGSLAEGATLEDAALNVGSKEFTEQLVLCEITAQALQSAGADVTRTCGLSGTNSVRSALLNDEVDLYWEYTGTGWITHLQRTDPSSDPEELFQAVAEADEEENGVVWLPPAPANNTYAVAVAEETAEELGIETLSDYAELVRTNPEQASFCGASEFFGRADGWPGLETAYEFDLPDAQTAELAAGAIYNSIGQGNPCVFGEVFATDGRVEALGLKVLEDDREFFTAYNPALTVGEPVIAEFPQIANVIAPVSEALDDETLRALNAQVDVEGLTPEQVAGDWLREQGFIQ
jgi:osmoprotectant transport system substrate-binding protein